MGAGDEILRRLDALEAKIDQLLASRESTGGSSQSPAGEALPDHMLENSWADKEIRKDPPRYSGPPMVGRRYSEATSEWHDANASFMAWKAEKGRTEVPVRLKANGKPWWESDAFEAKLCRSWSTRNRGRAAMPAHSPAPADDGFGGGPAAPFGADDLPFATAGDLPWSPPRWERW